MATYSGNSFITPNILNAKVTGNVGTIFTHGSIAQFLLRINSQFLIAPNFKDGVVPYTGFSFNLNDNFRHSKAKSYSQSFLEKGGGTARPAFGQLYPRGVK